MASTTTFPSLSVPAPEDTMEVSSPNNRHFDGDIDIDFEDTYDAFQLTDDERMLEDHEHARPGTATDEMMQDDEQIVTATVSEEVMHDDPASGMNLLQDEDDELIDYEDDEYLENPSVAVDDHPVSVVVQAEEEKAKDHRSPTAVGVPPEAVPVQPHQTEAAEGPQSAAPRGTEPVVPPHEQQSSPAATTEHETEDRTDSVVPAKERAPSLDARRGKDVLAAGEAAVDAAEGVPDPEVKPLEHQAQPIEQSTVAPHPIDTSVGSLVADDPPTPTDTGLHPMNILWRGQSMPLFKSRLQPDGLLKDDNLINVSLADFLSSCKERIAVKLGETVSQDQEFVLAFHSLGLTVVEDSPATFATSLNDVLEVYLQLHENDAAEDVPALSLSLALQPKFHSLLAYLKESAAQGQGMSAAEVLCNGAIENEYHDVDDGPAEEDGALEHHDSNGFGGGDGETHADTAEPYEQTDEAEYLRHPAADGREDGNAEGEDEHHGAPLLEADQADPYDAAEHAGSSEDGTGHQGPANGETRAEGDEGDEEEYDFNADAEDDEVDALAAEAESSSQAADQPQPQVIPSDSVQGSTTIRTDAVNDLTEPEADSVRDNASTRVSADRASVGRRLDQAPLSALPAADTSNVSELFATGDEDKDTFQLGSDGFSTGEFTQYAEDAAGGEDAEDADGLYEDVDEDAQDDLVYQTDNAAGDETNGVAVKPGENEDDDQFHTAYDLLEDTGHDGDPGRQPGLEDDNASYDQDFDEEDEIDFEDEAESVPAAEASATAPEASSSSLAAKRSIDELVEIDDFTTDEHEAKKARAT